MPMDKRYDEYRQGVEDALREAFALRGFPFDGLLEAMEYSVMAGGKRIRPCLVLEFCRAAGGDTQAALPVACAVEMLHTYSLIHDDLPCMDNDDLRRGKPTNHKVFGEWTALLAGDALQAEAFALILNSDLPDRAKLACAKSLVIAAGVDGICGGQYLDLSGDGKALTEDQLTEIQSRKTASLLVAACQMGVHAAGGDDAFLDAAATYGAALGAAFQIRDDMLDELADEKELGKPVGSDKAQGKTTFMTLYGREKCQQMVDRLTQVAKKATETFPDPGFLPELADELAKRNK
jgi:geranylgeranyl diphosphate synthase type II